MDKIRSFRGISAGKLIEVLKELNQDTKVCLELLGDNFPIKQVQECTYNDWSNGTKGQEHKGILIK